MIVCMLQTVAGSALKCHDFCRRRDFEEQQVWERLMDAIVAAYDGCKAPVLCTTS